VLTVCSTCLVTAFTLLSVPAGSLPTHSDCPTVETAMLGGAGPMATRSTTSPVRRSVFATSSALLSVRKTIARVGKKPFRWKRDLDRRTQETPR